MKERQGDGYVYLKKCRWSVRPIEKNVLSCITMAMKSVTSSKPARRLFQPSELLLAFQTLNFSAFRLSPPRQTDKGTYFNLSATTDGQRFYPLYVAFKDLKFVGQSSMPTSEATASAKNEKGTYDPTYNFQKFPEDGAVQPLFEVLEKLQEYLFSTMEDKIKKGEIACLDHRTAPHAKGRGCSGKESSALSPNPNPYQNRSGGWHPNAEPYGASAVVFSKPCSETGRH